MFAFVTIATVRLLQAIPVLLAVAGLSFVLFAYIGDPVTILLGQEHTEAERQALAQALGLDRPFLARYAVYVATILSGDFGVSFRLAQPVTSLIAQRAPATIELAVTATVL